MISNADLFILEGEDLERTLEGPFSVVPKPMFATKGLFCSVFEYLK